MQHPDGTAPPTGPRWGPSHPEPLTELIRRSGRGDQRAFASLYARTAPYVTGLLRRSQAPDRVDDLTVRTYVCLWARCADFDPDDGRVWTWLADQTRAAVRADEAGLQSAAGR